MLAGGPGGAAAERAADTLAGACAGISFVPADSARHPPAGASRQPGQPGQKRIRKKADDGIHDRRSCCLSGCHGGRARRGTRRRYRPDQPRFRRPVRPAASDHLGRNARGSPRRRRPPRAPGRHRRRPGHPRHHPGVPHVFQACYPIPDEAAAALDRAGQLLSAHLADAETRHRLAKGTTSGSGSAIKSARPSLSTEIGTSRSPASHAMMLAWAKTQEPGQDRLVDHPQDVEVTGALLMSLTTFVGRERELDDIRSLSGKESDLSPWLASVVSVRPAWPWSWASAQVTWVGRTSTSLSLLRWPTPAWSTAPGSNRWAADPAALRCKRRWSTCATQPPCWCSRLHADGPILRQPPQLAEIASEAIACSRSLPAASSAKRYPAATATGRWHNRAPGQGMIGSVAVTLAPHSPVAVTIAKGESRPARVRMPRGRGRR
jgi:hypothetical protein